MEGLKFSDAPLFSYVALVSGFSLGSKSDNLLPMGFLHHLPMASHNIAIIWQKNKILKFSQINIFLRPCVLQK